MARERLQRPISVLEVKKSEELSHRMQRFPQAALRFTHHKLETREPNPLKLQRHQTLQRQKQKCQKAQQQTREQTLQRQQDHRTQNQTALRCQKNMQTLGTKNTRVVQNELGTVKTAIQLQHKQNQARVATQTQQQNTNLEQQLRRPDVPFQQGKNPTLAGVAEHFIAQTDAMKAARDEQYNVIQRCKTAGKTLIAHARVQRFPMPELASAIQRFTDPLENTAVRSSAFAALGMNPSMTVELQRALADNEANLELQRKMASRDLQLEPDSPTRLSDQISSQLSGGQALPIQVKKLLELHFNTDLSKVRIHTDSTANELSQRIQAVAFTTGQHIFFQSGKYNPDSSLGFELLAHEVAHTIQQASGQVSPGIDQNSSLESAAQLEGQKAVSNKSVLKQKANTLHDFLGFPKPLESKVSRDPKQIQHGVQNTETRASTGFAPLTADTVQRLGANAKTWRETSKLKGNPPVRDEKNPPNTNIVEDEKTYRSLLNSVKKLLKEQQVRADKFKDSKTGQVSDYRYWFTKVYGFVTENEIKFAEERSFYYPSAVMLDVLYFDKLYEDNLTAIGAKQEAHWKAAFNTMRQYQQHPDSFPTQVAEIVMSLVAGMLAHIRFDLPRALAWVGESYKQQFGAKMDDLKPDFFSMGGVFDNATRQMFTEIKKQLAQQPIEQSGVDYLQSQNWTSTAMRNLIGADMSNERLLAWERAAALRNTGNLPTNPYKLENGQLVGNTTTGNHNPNWAKLPKEMQPSVNGLLIDQLGTYGQGLLGGLTTIGVITFSEELLVAWQALFDDPKQAAKQTTEQKAQMLLKLIEVSGSTARTPRLVMSILETSQKKGDLELLVNMVDAFELIKMMTRFGLNARDLVEQLLSILYYPTLVLMNAANQIAKWKESSFAQKVNKRSAQSIFNAQDNDGKAQLARILLLEYKIKTQDFME